jgi:hypothetical protein
MDLSAAVLGKSTVSYLVEQRTTAVLKIGRDTFDRVALAGVACFNFAAAANLSRILNAELRVADTRDVFDHVAPDRFVLPRLGPVSLAVLGAAFEAKGIGGNAPLENWFNKHREKTVTFAALKQHDARTNKPARRRRRKRA